MAYENASIQGQRESVSRTGKEYQPWIDHNIMDTDGSITKANDKCATFFSER